MISTSTVRSGPGRSIRVSTPYRIAHADPMDEGKELIPVKLLKTAITIAALGLASAARSQPTELFECNPWCREAFGGVYFDCGPEPLLGLRWDEVVGRQWYGPLRWEGPIKVRIEARPLPHQLVPTTLPLYVELRSPDGARDCRSDTGTTVWWTEGTSSCDSLWVESGVINTAFPVGFEYWLSLSAFISSDSLGLRASSPFVRCVELRRAQVAVQPVTWGRVKQLYQTAQ